MENIHSETYSLLIEQNIKDEAEKAKLFNAIEMIPAVQQKTSKRKQGEFENRGGLHSV